MVKVRVLVGLGVGLSRLCKVGLETKMRLLGRADREIGNFVLRYIKVISCVE